MGGKNALLKITVSVSTGERKKEGEAYAPSYIIDAPIWGNFGTALQERAVQGAMVLISGSLATPSIYVPAEGEPRINLSFDKVADVNILSDGGAKAEEAAPKAEKAAKKTKRVENSDEDDDDGIPF